MTQSSTDKLFGGLGDVGLVLQQDVERFLGSLLVDRVDVEDHQRAGPVESLRNARGLFEVELTDRPHDARNLVGQRLRDVRDLGQHDLTSRGRARGSRRASKDTDA